MKQDQIDLIEELIDATITYRLIEISHSDSVYWANKIREIKDKLKE
jgi:hypothetical protein